MHNIHIYTQYYTYYLPFLWQQAHTAVWASQPFPQHRFSAWSAFCAVFTWFKDLRPLGTTWCFPMDSAQHRIEFHQISAMLDPRLFSHETSQRNSSISVKVPEYTAFSAFLLLSCIPNANHSAFDSLQSLFADKAFSCRGNNLHYAGLFFLKRELRCCNEDTSWHLCKTNLLFTTSQFWGVLLPSPISTRKNPVYWHARFWTCVGVTDACIWSH